MMWPRDDHSWREWLTITNHLQDVAFLATKLEHFELVHDARDCIPFHDITDQEAADGVSSITVSWSDTPEEVMQKMMTAIRNAR